MPPAPRGPQSDATNTRDAVGREREGMLKETGTQSPHSIVESVTIRLPMSAVEIFYGYEEELSESNNFETTGLLQVAGSKDADVNKILEVDFFTELNDRLTEQNRVIDHILFTLRTSPDPM